MKDNHTNTNSCENNYSNNCDDYSYYYYFQYQPIFHNNERQRKRRIRIRRRDNQKNSSNGLIIKSASISTTTITINNLLTSPLAFYTIILVLLLSTVKSINSSLTMPSGSSSSSGTIIDLDPYTNNNNNPLHPHRHSRLNNLIIKALNSNNNNYYSDNENSNNNNNVYYEAINNGDIELRSNSHSGNSNSKINPAMPLQVFYANGATESTLPECAPMSVCNKIETYESPWVEKQCRCKHNSCSMSLSTSSSDPYSLHDKTRQYKLCEPVRELKKCRYFRDVTWTIITKGDNVTSQIVHCQCPKDSVAYMIKRGVYRSPSPLSSESDGKNSTSAIGFKYSFACSPISRVLCQRKEPCRLFTLKRRNNHPVNDVNSSTLCQCPKGFTCPAHHLEAGVIRGKLYPENSLRTYSGYCVQ